jgi:hypothetical protein
MSAMTDVIVSFWFLPVTLFIIIPLLMLCGYLVFKLLLKLVGLFKVRQNIPKEKVKHENAAIHAEGR